MGLFEKLTERAIKNRQRIVLPEGTEPRTLTAADRIIAERIADVILIGDPADILAMAKDLKLENIDKAQIVNPADEKVIEHVEHSVICDTPDNKIFTRINLTVFLVKSRAFDLFHSAAMVGDKHRPIKVGFDFNGIKLARID